MSTLRFQLIQCIRASALLRRTCTERRRCRPAAAGGAAAGGAAAGDATLPARRCCMLPGRNAAAWAAICCCSERGCRVWLLRRGGARCCTTVIVRRIGGLHRKRDTHGCSRHIRMQQAAHAAAALCEGHFAAPVGLAGELFERRSVARSHSGRSSSLSRVSPRRCTGDLRQQPFSTSLRCWLGWDVHKNATVGLLGQQDDRLHPEPHHCQQPPSTAPAAAPAPLAQWPILSLFRSHGHTVGMVQRMLAKQGYNLQKGRAHQ